MTTESSKATLSVQTPGGRELGRHIVLANAVIWAESVRGKVVHILTGEVLYTSANSVCSEQMQLL